MKRDERQMLDLILHVAKQDENVRAVIMNGSRASPGALKDSLQDYDLIYVVNEVERYVENTKWISLFGELLIMQLPDILDGLWPKSKESFAFLLQFKDGNRIDLTFVTLNKFINAPRDSQSILLLDKDNCLHEFPQSSDSGYLPTAPTATDFNNCCSEFFWVSLNVAKGIIRKQLPYAKYMSECIVKDELIKLLIWYAAIKTNFQISLGAYGKYLESYLPAEVWNKFRATYVNANYDNMWQALLGMCDLFNEIALDVAKHFGFKYKEDEYTAVMKYLNERWSKDLAL